MDSVSTVRPPVTMPGAAFGTTIVRKRRRRDAPSVAAASSSTARPAPDMLARAARTMKGSVNSTWPITMKAVLPRRPGRVPHDTISASAEARPGTATGSVSSSSSARATRPRYSVSTHAAGTPTSVQTISVDTATASERQMVPAYRSHTCATQRSVKPLDRPTK
ncbi:Uncharacterised protein [Bordetella ansorpii]|uniref:Uncharacterized protein n=1 Tax=Bordetella ansorpii TaxID=288768 RepID=A0A157KKF0_9BORD|nr:Uncharacterised protein [Bordetella ansorpii]